MKSLITGILCLICLVPLARAQFTFGSEVSSNPGSANEAYSSGSQTFTYTDTNTSGDDNAYLPLTGSAGNFISLSHSWSASLSVNLSSATLSKPSSASPIFGGALGLLITSSGSTSTAAISLGQNNNTGNSSNSDVPANFFGTLGEFEVDSNGIPQATNTLGSASNYNGSSYVELAGGTSGSPATETIGAANDILTLRFDAATALLTGALNGTSIGSYSLSALPAGSTVQLGVVGFSGEGVAVSGTMDTANALTVTPEPPTFLMLALAFAGLVGWRVLPRSGARA